MVTALIMQQPPYIRYLSYHQQGTLNILFDMAVSLTWRYATTPIFPDIRVMGGRPVTRTTNPPPSSTIQPVPAVSALPLIVHPLEPVPIIVKNTLCRIHHLLQHTSIQRCHPGTHIFPHPLTHTPAVSASTAVPDSAAAPCIQDTGV